jgi:hypothetical protein
LPKRQCALLIGFCGTGCNGMQMYVHRKSCVHCARLTVRQLQTNERPTTCSNDRRGTI